DGFIQDDWKLSRSVTLNLGARYEFNSPPIDAHDQISIFDLSTLKLVNAGKNGVSRSPVNADKNNFAPRFGLAWNLSQKGNLVLRWGYGIFYDSGTVHQNSSMYFNPPYFQLGLFVTGANLLKLDQPFPTGRGITPLTTVITVDPNFKTAYMQQWNLSIHGVV